MARLGRVGWLLLAVIHFGAPVGTGPGRRKGSQPCARRPSSRTVQMPAFGKEPRVPQCVDLPAILRGQAQLSAKADRTRTSGSGISHRTALEIDATVELR